MNKTIVEGHRGYCAKYPENTLISFEAALDLGVDAVEFDIWLTKDKVPVIMHDGNTVRTCNDGRYLRDMTFEEVRSLEPAFVDKFGNKFKGNGIKIPTLEEALTLFKKKNPSILPGVEIKEYTEETVDLTIELLKKYGLFENSYFYAFNGRIIKYIKQKYNGRTMGYPDFQMQEFEADTYGYYDEIGLAIPFVKSEIFEIYQKKNLPIHMYCADDEETVRLCIEKNASLVTANDPTALMKVLGRM